MVVQLILDEIAEELEEEFNVKNVLQIQGRIVTVPIRGRLFVMKDKKHICTILPADKNKAKEIVRNALI